MRYIGTLRLNFAQVAHLPTRKASHCHERFVPSAADIPASLSTTSLYTIYTVREEEAISTQFLLCQVGPRDVLCSCRRTAVATDEGPTNADCQPDIYIVHTVSIFRSSVP